MKENENNRIVLGVFFTLVIIAFASMFVYFGTEHKKMMHEEKRQMLCPYRFNSTVWMKDTVDVTFHGKLYYNYDSLSFEDVQIARSAVDVILREVMSNYTSKDLLVLQSSYFSDIVNHVLGENGFPCKWDCCTLSFKRKETHERMNSHIEELKKVKSECIDSIVKISKQVEVDDILLPDTLRIGRPIKEKKIFTGYSPFGGSAWFRAFQKHKK